MKFIVKKYYDIVEIKNEEIESLTSESIERLVGDVTRLQEIEIPEGVKKIGHGTFEACTYLKKITLPKSLKTIGESAFSNCEYLEEIEIPEGIEVINEVNPILDTSNKK